MTLPGPRKLKIVLAVFGLLGGLFAAAIMLALNRLQNPEFVLEKLRLALGGTLPAQIELAEISIGLPRTIRLGGIRITLPAVPERPLLVCKEIAAQLNLGELLSGRVHLEGLQIRDFEVGLVRGNDGKLALPVLGAFRRAELPEMEREGGLFESGRMLAAAGAMPVASPFRIASIECERGRVNYQDRPIGFAVSVTDVEARMAFSPEALEIGSATGRVLDGRTFRISGRVGLTGEPAPNLTLQVPELPIRLIQTAAGTAGNPWPGTVAAQLTWRIEGGRHLIGGPLTCKQIAITEERIRQTISIPSGTVKLAAQLASTGELTAGIDIDCAGMTVTPLDPGFNFPCEGLLAGLDLSGVNVLSLSQAVTTQNMPALAGAVGALKIAIRSCDAKVGGGTLTLKGGLNGFQSQIDVQANRVGLGSIVSSHPLVRGRPWLSGAVVRTLTGKLSLGEFAFAPLEIDIGGSLLAATGALRPDATGAFAPTGIRGTAEIEGALLASLLGTEMNRFAGRASIGYMVETTGFTCELRSTDLAVRGAGPDLVFSGLAAAARGLPAGPGRYNVVANLNAGSFTLSWPLLWGGMGLGIEGPLRMDSGEAFIRSDESGIHVSGLKCQGSATMPSPIGLTGQVDVRHDGTLSGVLQTTAPSYSKSFQLAGTLAAPLATPR